MTTITITQELRNAAPDLRLGLLSAKVQPSATGADLRREMLDVAGELKSSAGNIVASSPEIQALNRTYRALGKDPARYRGSAEALLRRIAGGKALYHINNLVDVNNRVSIETRCPCGIYNRAHLAPPLHFSIGTSGEQYKGIGKELINIADLPVFVDANGPFGSPTSDSERAMITLSTDTILMVIIDFSGHTSMTGHLEYAITLMKRFAEAQDIQTEIVA